MSGDFSPTASWGVTWPCDVSTESPTATGQAVAFATEILWSLTGQRFGFTTVKLRPCQDYPQATPFPDGWQPWQGLQWSDVVAGGVGWGWGGGGWFFSYSCGGCQYLTSVTLPAPVHAITEVRVNGVVLATNAYRIDQGRQLVRVDGLTWPTSNNLLLPDTVAGTWSVTAQYGEQVPSGAAIAVGELACEFLKGLSGQDCRLPRSVTQLARQGVTMTMPDVSSQFEKGLTGLFFADMFIKAWNPNGLRTRARAYSVDRPARGRVG